MIQRINPYNRRQLKFLYGTRFNAKVMETLYCKEIPEFEQHVEYIQKKDKEGHLFFIVIDYKLALEGKFYMVGYCQAQCIKENVWELGWAIHPSVQGQGYGKRSVQLLLNELTYMNASSAELVVQKKNLRAFALYAKCGFVVTETTDDSWRMSISL